MHKKQARPIEPKSLRERRQQPFLHRPTDTQSDAIATSSARWLSDDLAHLAAVLRRVVPKPLPAFHRVGPLVVQG